MVWWNLYVVVFMSAVILSLIVTPFFRVIAVKFDFMDVPRQQDHKRHRHATPLMGGAALCTAWLGTIIMGILAVKFLNRSSFDQSVSVNVPGIFFVSRKVFFICLGAVLSTLLGLYDDKYLMSARTKFLFQFIIAAIVVTWGGVQISAFISNSFVVWIISVFWILVIFNAINFFDNMDGLAIGTATIAFAFFTIAAMANQQYFVASLCAATAGASLGFWFYNYPPASIFMGDSGSHFLGYLLAVNGALVTFYNPEISMTRFPVLIPFIILAIPLFDLGAVVLIRLYAGKSIYIGDNNHISHRFVAMGISKKEAVFAVQLLTIIVGLSVLPLIWGDEKTIIVCLIQAVTILILISVLQYAGKKNLNRDKEGPADKKEPEPPPLEQEPEPLLDEEDF